MKAEAGRQRWSIAGGGSGLSLRKSKWWPERKKLPSPKKKRKRAKTSAMYLVKKQDTPEKPKRE